MFRSILSLRHKALPFISIEIKNGDSTFFWWDPWTPYGILRDFLGSDTSLGIPLSATVADLHHGNGWALPNARSENQVLLLSYISTLHLSTGSDQAVWSVNGAKNKEFSSKQNFNAIRRSVPCKIWATLVWHKASIPRHSTTTWLFILNRNPTFDRLLSWNVDVEPFCLLCGEGDESRNHLFFECSFSSVVWRFLLRRFRFSSLPLLWSDILLWLPIAHPDAMVKLGILQVWQASIYELWKERNRRSHEGLTQPPARIMRYISETLRDKCSALLSLGHPLGPRLARFWFDPP